MTDTARRALLGAIAAAPLLPVAPAHAATRATLPVFPPRGGPRDGPRFADILATGAALRCDPVFAHACAEALEAFARSDAADQLHEEAAAAAEAATPAFPPELVVPCVMRDWRTGEPKSEWDERARPTDAVVWDRAVARYVHRTGADKASAERRLRAAWEAWNDARTQAEAAFLTPELGQAAEAAYTHATAVMDRTLAHPARSVGAVLTKLALHASDTWADERAPAAMETLAADLRRAAA